MNKMLIFEIKDAENNCFFYVDGDCGKHNGEHSCNDKYCPLPNVDWKEKLLNYTQKTEWDRIASMFYDPEHPVIDTNELKQKIKEL